MPLALRPRFARSKCKVRAPCALRSHRPSACATALAPSPSAMATPRGWIRPSHNARGPPSEHLSEFGVNPAPCTPASRRSLARHVMAVCAPQSKEKIDGTLFFGMRVWLPLGLLLTMTLVATVPANASSWSDTQHECDALFNCVTATASVGATYSCSQGTCYRWYATGSINAPVAGSMSLLGSGATNSDSDACASAAPAFSCSKPVSRVDIYPSSGTGVCARAHVTAAFIGGAVPPQTASVNC